MAATGISSTGVGSSASATVIGAVSGRDYRALLSMLLPRGKAWTRQYGTVLQNLLAGAAGTFDAVHVRAAQLLAEMDPRTATETIADWERITKPYGEHEPPIDLATRRAAVASVWTSRGAWAGAPGILFFTTLLESLGYEVAFRRFHRKPFKCTSKCTDNLNTAQAGWYSVVEFIITNRGEALNALAVEQIERYAQGHLATAVAFPMLDVADSAFTRASTAVLRIPYGGTATNLASGARGEIFHGV